MISIHAPRTGSDLIPALVSLHATPFQSTLPARGATQANCKPDRDCAISIHAPRTGSDRQTPMGALKPTISIHAPRTGSDTVRDSHVRKIRQFQSTLPARGATLPIWFICKAANISIHAPRTGSDDSTAKRYPHWYISIHAPRTGSDFKGALAGIGSGDFNPRSPHGERHNQVPL